jgi:VWFA-related protein
MSAGFKPLILLTAAGLLPAQSIPSDEIHARTGPYVPPSAVTIRTEVRVVEVPVVVRDSHLHTVAGLNLDDFEIDDNGKKQPITSFSVQKFKVPDSARATGATVPADAAPRPRFLALCFDDLHLLPTLLQPVKDAAARFVKTSLAPNDRVVIVRTSRSEKAQFTADVPALLDQIEKITSTPQAVFNDSERCIHLNPYEAYMIAEQMDPGDRLLHAKTSECAACYHNSCPDAMVSGTAKAMWAHTRTTTVNALSVIDSLVEGMAKLPGQRVVLLTSGGFLTGTLETDLDGLMDKARRSEVLINALDARGLYSNASAGMAYDGMGILASGTGGTFFHNNNSMEEGFRELGMVPETIYMLGFAPPGADDGSFHKLKVRIAASKSYSIEARLGYTARPPMADLESEVSAADTMTDLPASFTWEQWAGPPSITMIAHVDIGRMHFKANQDRRAQKLTIVAVLLDSRGTFIAGKRSELQLNFKDSTFEQFAKTGFTAALTIPAPPGTYSVRAVAQDAMESKLAAASSEVKIK